MRSSARRPGVAAFYALIAFLTGSEQSADLTCRPVRACFVQMTLHYNIKECIMSSVFMRREAEWIPRLEARMFLSHFPKSYYHIIQDFIYHFTLYYSAYYVNLANFVQFILWHSRWANKITNEIRTGIPFRNSPFHLIFNLAVSTILLAKHRCTL